ncbi:hypothetical protein ACLMJK_006258 [Lecanora helva]
MALLTSLAEEILIQARKLDNYLSSQGRQCASFDHDSLSQLPPELKEAQEAVVNLAHTVKKLALRPESLLEEIMWSCADQISLGAINEFRIAKHVPETGSASFEEIGDRSRLPAQLVERLLRQAMTNRIFTEDETGQVKHTAASRLLARDADLSDAITMMAQESWRPSTRVTDAIKKYPECQEPNEAAFALVNEPGVSMFDFLARQPQRARYFDRAMRYYASLENCDLKHLVNGYAWSDMDRPGVVMVDVGGGQGWVSRALAQATGNIRFIVQDLKNTAEDGERLLPQDLSHRIEFTEHDFFIKQPVEKADIYFLRWVLHDWSDKYAVMILRNLVPALKDGARVILYERVSAEGAETRFTEKHGRDSDLVMLAQFNGQERTLKAFEALFQEADPRYQMEGAHRPAESAMTIVEMTWKPNTLKEAKWPE